MPILVIDDDDDIRMVISELLADEGYTVIPAANGHAALACLQSAHPQPRVIILDLMMPIMNGWEFLRARQDDPIVRTIPVIVVSATPSIKEAIITLGAQEALGKPIDFDQLVALVQRYRVSAPAP